MSNPESALSTPSDSVAALTEGQKLAGVYVLKQLASAPDSGAVIWLAHDEVLGKDVSLHFIPPAVRTDGRAMTELRQEIKRNRQLIHPNILRVYDLIEEPDWAAISMDSFEGESVASLQRKKESGFFEPGDVKAWFQQLCLALEDVHKVNLLHRNVSPPNLVLDKSGKLLLTNFGISRVIEDALGRARKEGVDRHLAFLSPQQLDGEPATRADDIYSLGATLYEVLTGEAPFVEGEGELVSQIRKVTPQSMMERRAKLGKKGGTILPTWEKTVAACLAKAPNERPPTAADLVAKLGLSGKLAPAAEPPTGAAAAVPTNVVPMRPEPQKKMPPVKTVSPPRKEPPVTAAPAASAASSSSPKSYSEIAAAVEADEWAAVQNETETRGGKNAPSRPSGAYSQKSNGPMIVAAAGVLIAAVCGYLWWSSNQNSNQAVDNPPSPKSQTIADVSPAKPASSTEHEQASPPPPSDQQPPVGNDEANSGTPVTGADLVPRSSAEAPSASGPSGTASINSSAKPPASNASGANPSGGNSSGGNSSGGGVSNANPPPQKSTASVSASAATPIAEPPPSIPTDGLLLAESKRTKKGDKSTDTAPATPAPASPSSSSAKGGDAPLTLAEAQRAADNAAKKAQETHKQQQDADAAAAEAQKSLDQKTKSAAPLVEAAKDLQSQRQDKEDAMKAADLAAQQARQTAEEKSKLAEESKKALADWVSKNGGKLTARDNANAEVQLLQKTLTDKQSAAASAARAVTDADAVKEHAAAALKKAQEAESARVAEAAAKKASEEKAAKRAQLDDELQKVDQMRKDLEEKMKKLEDLKKEIDVPATSAPASQSDLDSKPSPAPIASAPLPKKLSSPPAPPPGPKPVVPPPSGGPVESGLDVASNSTPLALSTEPAPLPPPKSPPEGKSSSGQVVFENSLGMKFAPLGDVLFCVWPTRVIDFEAFAKDTALKSSLWRNPGFTQGPDHPVVNVTWTEAMAFCKWLTERERKKGMLNSSQFYRLPYDLEWSKGVSLPEESGRTPEQRDLGVPDVYPWGVQWPPPPNSGNYTGEETGSEVAIKGYDDGYAWTSPVGSFPPNKYGLYDMGGNVWQWCMDSWNPTSKEKVLRGASWYNGSLKLSLLSSCRLNSNPDNSTDNYGFRIVRASESAKGKGK